MVFKKLCLLVSFTFLLIQFSFSLQFVPTDLKDKFLSDDEADQSETIQAKIYFQIINDDLSESKNFAKDFIQQNKIYAGKKVIESNNAETFIAKIEFSTELTRENLRSLIEQSIDYPNMDMVQVSFPDIPDFGEYFSEGQRLLNEDTDKSEDEKRAMIHQKIYTSLIKDYPYARYVLGTEATNAFAAITCHPSLKDLTTYQIEGFMDGNIVTKEILESELQSLILEEGRSAIFGPLLADFNGPTFLYIDIANRANALDFLKLILFQSKYPSTTAMNWEYIREANSENWDPVYLLRAKN